VNTIVIATDGSRGAWAAIEHGIDLAEATGATVLFVTVCQPSSSDLEDTYRQGSLVGALACLRSAVTYAESQDVAADSVLLQGDPAQEIVGLAHKRNADLIVVGARGRTAASSPMGSVSQQIVREADRPVLVVREQPAARRRVAL
jgi:nucleotide-binding universal stress UspA family protein